MKKYIINNKCGFLRPLIVIITQQPTKNGRSRGRRGRRRGENMGEW
jgi:hypothetical protein